jgi:hypothetical protein
MLITATMIAVEWRMGLVKEASSYDALFSTYSDYHFSFRINKQKKVEDVFLSLFS